MDIEGKRVLVLGGYGLVGSAVCRALMPYRPARLVVGSLRQEQAKQAVADLRVAFPGSETDFVPVWGDVLLRAEWQASAEGGHPRDALLSDPAHRQRLLADILDELGEDILSSSLLYQYITGTLPALDGQAADIVIDCMNTATAVAYQNVYQVARRLEERIKTDAPTDWAQEVEQLLSYLYVPQLVRHMQILYEGMVRAGTQAYVKVGTSGTGGMGFNIPYTHGEERPSRVLLSKSAVAGAQTMLIFLLARTPGAPPIVKEIKPTAAIAWKEIAFGPIRAHGRDVPLYDCPPGMAYPLDDPRTLESEGAFGQPAEGILESVYIDSGENGLFAAGEFTALTSLGQMEFVTPEEIANNVVAEIRGGSTGRDIVAGLDGSVMGPSYRAAFLRNAAVTRLHQLEQEHQVDSVAFELLGPPRLSKLLFEIYLIKRVASGMSRVLEQPAEKLSTDIWGLLQQEAGLRQSILSIGIPILLPDGGKMLRGPQIKSPDAEHGWVDLTPSNMSRWKQRLQGLAKELAEQAAAETSSAADRSYPSSQAWKADDQLDIGAVVGWVFNTEEGGRRGKS